MCAPTVHHPPSQPSERRAYYAFRADQGELFRKLSKPCWRLHMWVPPQRMLACRDKFPVPQRGNRLLEGSKEHGCPPSARPQVLESALTAETHTPLWAAEREEGVPKSGGGPALSHGSCGQQSVRGGISVAQLWPVGCCCKCPTTGGCFGGGRKMWTLAAVLVRTWWEEAAVFLESASVPDQGGGGDHRRTPADSRRDSKAALLTSSVWLLAGNGGWGVSRALPRKGLTPESDKG